MGGFGDDAFALRRNRGVRNGPGRSTSIASAAGAESLYAEINKLPGRAKLEDGKRHDGALLYFSISDADLISAYTKAFTQRYPLIKPEFYGGSGNQRTFMEHNGNRLGGKDYERDRVKSPRTIP